MTRRVTLLLTAATVIAVGGVGFVAFGSASSPAAAQSTPPATGTAKIARRTLTATTQVDGTLGYADTYALSNSLAISAGGSGGGGGGEARQVYDNARAQYDEALVALDAIRHPTSAHLLQLRIKQAEDALTAARAAIEAASETLSEPRGVLTEIAPIGSTVGPGQILYQLDGDHPAVLMAGGVPAWRDIASGVADGTDIEQLETNLRALGFAPAGMAVDRHWGADTTAAVKAWQKALGTPQTGAVPLGTVVFEPVALRITAHSASLGAAVQQGTAILAATSTTPVVTVALDPALQTKVANGDAVSVTMPDGSSATGIVSEVGTVATAPQGGDQTGQNATPTIDVTVALDDPSSTGGLDQAPVSVNITTATAENVLAVPVSALVELLEGGYAVQVRADDGSTHYTRVQLGLFANGWVAITAQDLAEGQTVVVPQ